MRSLVAAVALALVLAAPAAGSGPIDTAVFASGTNPLFYERAHDAGAKFIRVNVPWASVAPKVRGAAFVASDPADPRYDWTNIDAQVELSYEHRLTPFFTIYDAPLWAEKDEPHPTSMGPFPIASWKPDPAQLAAFAHALAVRYGGAFQGLPRVRHFELWNESNLNEYLSPQLEQGKVVSGSIYRGLLNAFAPAIHAVHRDNVVIAGSLSAFSFRTVYGRLGISPMQFMRNLLCMSARNKPTCKTSVDADVVSIHPWTSGSPTHHASEKGDLSLGDLAELKRLLVAAAKAGHINPHRVPPVWITEFAWDTKPPDPHPDVAPIALQSRWVSEAVYQAWKNGIQMFTWLQLWDDPYPAGVLQSGLFFRNGENFVDAQPKPTFYAFRFPFVAYRHGGKVAVWGRVPYGRPGSIAVQRRTTNGWRWAGTFKTNRYGVFSGTVGYHPPTEQKIAKPATGTSSYHDLVVSAAPMSYWPLDEQDGSAAADVVNAKNGAYVGNVRLGAKGPLPGTTAASFDGRTAKVQLGRVTTVHSVELWLKTRTTKDAVAFSNRNSIHEFVALGTLGGLAHVHDSYPIYGGALGDGRWHHVVYTYDSTTSTGKVYIDGKLSQLAVWRRQEGGAPASIAYDASLKSFFAGQIAQVAVYSYALTPEQIRSHYLASGRRIAPDVAPGMLRAYAPATKAASLPFSLVRPPDRYVLPFGSGG